jgi:hypothetical protein
MSDETNQLLREILATLQRIEAQSKATAEAAAMAKRQMEVAERMSRLRP